MSANPIVSGIGLSDVEIVVRTATIDPPSMATTVDGLVADVNVPDVAIGDAILAVPPYDTVNIIYQATAVSNNTLDVNFYNAGTGTTNLASGVWTFIIIKTGAR